MKTRAIGIGASVGSSKSAVRSEGDVRRVIGLDVGGTRIRGGVVSEDGSVEMVEQSGTAADRGAEAVLDNLCRVIERCADRAAERVAVGLAIPGIPDETSQRLEHVANLFCLKGLPIVETIRGRTGLAVRMLPDVHAAGLAEYRFGAGRGARRLIVTCVGTGVGAAVILNGAFVRHTRGMAGSLGHLVVDPEGERCGCGGRGCIETRAAGPALRRVVERYAGADWLRRNEIAAAEGSATGIAEALAAGEPSIVRAVEEVGRWLGVGIASWAAIYRPERVVLGGGLAGLGKVWLSAVREGLRGVSPEFYLAGLEVRLGECLQTGGVLGAGLWAMEEPGTGEASV